MRFSRIWSMSLNHKFRTFSSHTIWHAISIVVSISWQLRNQSHIFTKWTFCHWLRNTTFKIDYLRFHSIWCWRFRCFHNILPFLHYRLFGRIVHPNQYYILLLCNLVLIDLGHRCFLSSTEHGSSSNLDWILQNFL